MNNSAPPNKEEGIKKEIKNGGCRKTTIQFGHVK